MTPEPRRVAGPRVPLDLFVRRSTTDPRLFDVVDEAGAFIAREVPDLNTARVLATAPRLLDGFYEMRWRLNVCFVHQFDGIDERYAMQARVQDWLTRMAAIEADACAPDGRFPL